MVLVFFLCLACSAEVKEYKLKVVKEYPHDETSYTQGLFIQDGVMYESTGQYGESSFRVVDMETGNALRRLDFNKDIFVEGSVMLDEYLYILTWTNNQAYIYDSQTLEYKYTYSYPREGWGLTTDGKQLIASDGTSRLYFMDKHFKVEKTLDVTLEGRKMPYINELEYIDGKIWANVYTLDMILIISPKTGEVEATVDCTGLLDRKYRTSKTDVLNGIAYDKNTRKIYLTGKYWKRLYEIQLEEK